MATKRFKIQNGVVSTVYSDMLPKLNLGDMVVKRASNVEYDHAKREWEARIPETNELIAHGTNRDQVIQQEVAVIEQRL